MSILSKLSSAHKSVAIEPRDIFMLLPNRDKKYEYPRDVQSEVWRKWFENRNKKDCIIKMNTGSGKTVVGLLILQSCLNEGMGPAVYAVPDKYLVSQVFDEAQKLGISVTTNKEDYSYIDHKSILITTIHSIVNGRSAFGMRTKGSHPIGSLLMDDVHACLDTINEQFSIRIPVEDDLYNELIMLFENEWKNYNPNSYSDIINERDCFSSTMLPFWIWQDKNSAIYDLLGKYKDDESNNTIYFNYPLIKDCLHLCDCFISSREIEIIPDGISISRIKGFTDAKRRIYMSATLYDDSVFVASLGIHKKDISIIVPDNANDIGDRMILFPRLLNFSIKNNEIKSRVFTYAEEYNVVVIVPSFEKAKYWDPKGDFTATKENIEDVVAEMKKQKVGLMVFVNRYGGIDLPDNACRILVIDGLPPFRNEKAKYISSIDSSNSILIREQVQIIEQGIGRGVRSNSDSCCIILMDDCLTEVLHINNGICFFSSATKKQYELSKKLWDLLKEENQNPDIDCILQLMDFSLERNIEWVTNSKESLSDVSYSSEIQLDSTVLALRDAYEHALIGEWDEAIAAIDSIINSADIADSTKGYLLQIKAKYMNFIDKLTAQQVLKSGKKYNRFILTPIEGIQYDKAIQKKAQPNGICSFIQESNFTPNNFIMFVGSVVSELTLPHTADDFEKAIWNVGKLLGFVSTRPDKETKGEGPDNLWAAVNDMFYVIECKSEATTEAISKRDCNQLGGSIRWFEQEYGGHNAIPVMVHPSKIIDKQATAVPNMRVITLTELESLGRNINAFAIALVRNENWMNANKICDLLSQYKLRSTDLLEQYMVKPTNEP